MMEKMRNRKKKKGFTLIELIVVIVIIGILAAIAIPRLGGFGDSATDGRIRAEHRQLISAIQMWQSNQDDSITAWPEKLEDLGEYFDGGTASLVDKAHVLGTNNLVSTLNSGDTLTYPTEDSTEDSTED